MPLREKNFAPRAGLGYAIGDDRPLMVRAGFGIFYTRIPQIYESAVMNVTHAPAICSVIFSLWSVVVGRLPAARNDSR
jgi:hypothetical protein